MFLLTKGDWICTTNSEHISAPGGVRSVSSGALKRRRNEQILQALRVPPGLLKHSVTVCKERRFKNIKSFEKCCGHFHQKIYLSFYTFIHWDFNSVNILLVFISPCSALFSVSYLHLCGSVLVPCSWFWPGQRPSTQTDDPRATVTENQSLTPGQFILPLFTAAEGKHRMLQSPVPVSAQDESESSLRS